MAHQTYDEYLQSTHWRVRRNARLRLSKFVCDRCSSPRDLQVHHLDYSRLGRELDSDLEVVCRECHEKIHQTEDKKSNVPLYLQVIRDVIRSGAFDSYSDFLEALKSRCSVLKIPYDAGRLAHAIDIALERKPGIIAVPAVKAALEAGEDPPPLTQDEARRIMRQLNIKIGLREMPNAKPLMQRTADRVKAAQMVMGEITASIERCEELERIVEPE